VRRWRFAHRIACHEPRALRRFGQRLFAVDGALAAWAELTARSGLAAVLHDDRPETRCNVRSHDVAHILLTILRLLSAYPQA
jgi:hypothetical protein